MITGESQPRKYSLPAPITVPAKGNADRLTKRNALLGGMITSFHHQGVDLIRIITLPDGPGQGAVIHVVHTLILPSQIQTINTCESASQECHRAPSTDTAV